jgi:hypothetical protein
LFLGSIASKRRQKIRAHRVQDLKAFGAQVTRQRGRLVEIHVSFAREFCDAKSAKSRRCIAISVWRTMELGSGKQASDDNADVIEEIEEEFQHTCYSRQAIVSNLSVLANWRNEENDILVSR